MVRSNPTDDTVAPAGTARAKQPLFDDEGGDPKDFCHGNGQPETPITKDDAASEEEGVPSRDPLTTIVK